MITIEELANAMVAANIHFAGRSENPDVLKNEVGNIALELGGVYIGFVDLHTGEVHDLRDAPSLVHPVVDA